MSAFTLPKFGPGALLMKAPWGSMLAPDSCARDGHAHAAGATRKAEIWMAVSGPHARRQRGGFDLGSGLW